MNGDEEDPGDKTPPRTPSARAALGLVTCPKCKGAGLEASGTKCELCKGGKSVAVDAAIEYAQKNPK